MAVLQGNAKQGSTRGFYPRVINGSLRFNDDDSAYLSWTPASAGNRKTWTLSFWTKRGRVDNANTEIFGTAPEGDKLSFTDSRIFWFNEGSSQSYLSTTALFRDPSAWYHIVLAFDTTQATASNRVKLYVNGVQFAFDNNTTFPSLNYDGDINNTQAQYIGRGHGSNYYDGYLADVYFIDGQALSASDFGSFKNGVWVAEDYAGTFGTNGFHLTFEDDTAVEAFNTVLYRGNGGTQSITGVGFQPDLVWVKNRSNSDVGIIQDTVRGANKNLIPSATNAEFAEPDNDGVRSFDSDGFTLGFSGSGAWNNTANNYVAWCWKAGDSNVSNTDGSITSTVRANDTYGFSIVSTEDHTGSQTVGHGLSSAPDWIVAKARNGALIWPVYHSALGNTKRLRLNDSTQAETNAVWGNTDPTTSVFTFNQSSSTYNYIFYCWAEKTGYSKFGSYTGTGSAGNAVTGLGFTPSLIMIKRTDSTGDWIMVDNTRGSTNILRSNLSNAESVGYWGVESQSDGFEITISRSETNASGGTYIYAAFADTREAAFWLDQSGNDNDWQPVNLDHNDTVADSPTDNFCTFNPLAKGPNNVLSDGNLQVVHGGTGGWQICQSTFAFPESGKWYCEFTIVYQGGGTDRVGVGVSTVGYGPINTGTNLGAGNNANAWVYFAHTGSFYHNGVSSGSASTFGTGDVIQVCFDSDTGSLYFGKNGVWQNSGNPVAGTGYAYTGLSNVAVGTEGYTDAKVLANFGQQPFKYDPPA